MNSTRKTTTILFLYSELAGYFLACLGELMKNDRLKIHVVHFKVNPDAPFRLEKPEGVFFYEREKYSPEELRALVTWVAPDLIYCSGWIDKSYLSVCRSFKKRIAVVIALDNPWKGTLRQKVSVFLKPLILNIFTHAWVAGKRQMTFAKNLGFTPEKIISGVYSGNTFFYQSLYRKYREKKKINFPKKFLFVGRYARSKGTDLLADAFLELKNETGHEWELICAGAGPEKKLISGQSKITDLGFIQTEKMEAVIERSGVLILPSRYEPWGLVVHEFASAGFPLICSDEVGASELFLNEGVNGYSFRSGNKDSLKECMRKMILRSDTELACMGDESSALGLQQSPEKWSQKLISLIQSE